LTGGGGIRHGIPGTISKECARGQLRGEHEIGRKDEGKQPCRNRRKTKEWSWKSWNQDDILLSINVNEIITLASGVGGKKGRLGSFRYNKKHFGKKE